MSTCVISALKGEEIVGTFYKKELQKTNEKEFRIEKYWNKKVINYISDEKVIIIHLILIVGLIEMILLYKNELSSTFRTKKKLN